MSPQPPRLAARLAGRPNAEGRRQQGAAAAADAPPRRRRLPALLLVAACAQLTQAAAARERLAEAAQAQPAQAQPEGLVAGPEEAGPRGPAAAPEATPPKGLAASEVNLTEGILAFEEGKDPLAAELFAAAVSADPQNGTALHWLGVAQLRLGRAAAAVRTLAAALAAGRPAEAGRWQVTADLGAAQLAAGDLKAALRTLGAAAEHQPRDPLTWWRYGTALLRSGQEGAAAKALQTSRELGGAPPPAAPLGAAPEPPVVAPPYPGAPPTACTLPPPRWEGRLSLEADYDSNPGLLPADATFLPLTGARTAGTATDGGGDLDLRLEHHPFNDLGGWSLGLGVAGNRSVNRRQSDLDLSLAGGFLQLALGKDPRGYLAGPLGTERVPAGDDRLGLLLQAAGTWLRLGATDYLRLAGGAGSLTVHGPGGSATRIDLGASQLRFAGDLPGDLRRSGSELAAGIGESLSFGGSGGAGAGYLQAGANAGERQAGAAFAHRFVEVTVEAASPPAAGWTFYLEAARRQERFAHPQSNLAQPAGPARDDASWRGSVAAQRTLSPHLACTARASYVRRDSNVELPGQLPLLDYRRTTAGVGVTWFF